MTVDLKATDWTLAAGHRLAVEVGSIQARALGDWRDTPSGETITVTGARLDLALDDPADDTSSPAAARRTGWTATWPRTRVR